MNSTLTNDKPLTGRGSVIFQDDQPANVERSIAEDP